MRTQRMSLLFALPLGGALLLAQDRPDVRPMHASSSLGNVVWQYNTGG